MRQKSTHRSYAPSRRHCLDGGLGTDGERVGSAASLAWEKRGCSSWQGRLADGGAWRWWVGANPGSRGCLPSWRLSCGPADLYNSIYKACLQRRASTCAWPSRSTRKSAALVPTVPLYLSRGIGQQPRPLYSHPRAHQQKFPLHPH